jgi:N-methylhydantoinase A
MEKAIRVVSIEQGYDPREFSLLSFGGAGALHACELAASLSMPRVIVPPAPGALSAYGILVSDVVKDFSRTAPMLISADSFNGAAGQAADIFAELKQAALAEYQREGWKGALQLECSIDMRYQGQGYELRIPWRRSPALLDDFHAAHQKRFGYQHIEKKVEAVTFRVRGSIPQKTSAVSPVQRKSVQQSTTDLVYIGGKPIKTKILQRESMPSGYSASGPLVVNECTATTIVPPGWSLSVHRSVSLILEPAQALSKQKRRSR